MSKKHFIALADMIRETEPLHHSLTLDPANARIQWEIMRDKLADFCAAQNPNFKRDRWLAYIAGECGKNGGRK